MHWLNYIETFLHWTKKFYQEMLNSCRFRQVQTKIPLQANQSEIPLQNELFESSYVMKSRTP